MQHHSMHTLNPASSVMPAMPSVFRPMPMHTTAILPHRDTPALGLGLDLNPAIDEDAHGESGPDFRNPSSTPLWPSNSISTSFSGLCMGSTITVASTNTTLSQHFPNMNGELELYTPFMGDETMFMFSPQGISGTFDDADVSYDFPFTPFTPTIPLPMPALGSASSQVSTPPTSPSWLPLPGRCLHQI